MTAPFFASARLISLLPVVTILVAAVLVVLTSREQVLSVATK